MKFLTDKEHLASIKNVDVINKFMKSVVEYSEDQEKWNKSMHSLFVLFKDELLKNQDRLQEIEKRLGIVNLPEEKETPVGKKGGLDGLH